MPKSHSHVLRNRRYWGEVAAKFITDWLNKRGEADAKSRVIDLLRDIHEFYEITEPGSHSILFGGIAHPFHAKPLVAKGTAGGVRPWSHPQEFGGQGRRIRRTNRLHDRINRRLANYSFVPALLFGDVGANVDWFPRCPARAQMEMSVIHNIVTLSELNVIARVRQCSHCGKWLFAKFRHQRFCNSSCQQAHYWKSEEGKALRREYMRRYRRIKSLPNIK